MTLFAVANFGNLNPLGAFSTAGQTGSFVSAVIGLITILSGLYFLLQLAIAGMSYAASGGDEKGLAKARRAMSSSLLGFVIVVASYFVVGYVATRLGFSTIFSPTISGSSNIGCIKVTYTLPATHPAFDYIAELRVNGGVISQSNGNLQPGKSITLNGSFGKSVYTGTDPIRFEVIEMPSRNLHIARNSSVGSVPVGSCLNL